MLDERPRLPPGDIDEAIFPQKKGDHLATRDQLPGKGATAKKGFDFVVKTGELWCSLQSSICGGDDSGGKMSRTKK